MLRIINNNFITEKRLKNYPRVIFVVTWVSILFKLIFHKGWSGAFGQILATDFVTFYSAGQIYRFNIENLYNPEYQFNVQQALIYPTTLPGVNFFVNPPYVAFAYSLLIGFSLPAALAIWYLLTFSFVILALRLISQFIPANMRDSSLSPGRLLIILLSWYPFVSGLQSGQNHGLSLLLVSGILLFTLKEKWLLAGILAGLLIYKPQFCLGFLIVWLVWRQYKPVIVFAIVACMWAGITIYQHGLSPFLDFLSLSNLLVILPYVDGFPNYLMLTPYSLLASIFPSSISPIIQQVTLLLSLAMTVFLAWAAYRVRRKPMNEIERGEVLLLALIFPLVSTPYALIYDLVILIPGMVLWANSWPSRALLRISAALYLGAFILPAISYGVGIALLATIPISLAIILIYRITNGRKVGEGKTTHVLVE